MASIPRTGSTLLCRSLWDSGRAGAPKEYLNPMQIRDWQVRMGSRTSSWVHRALHGPAVALAGRWGWNGDDLARHLARVRARRSSAEGWFGLKIHHHHFRQWFLDADRDPEAWLGPTRWILLTRDDRIAQAVSWARAVQTGRWAAHQRGYAPPVYDRARIDHYRVQIEQQEAAWEAWLAHRDVLRLTYEQVVQDLHGTMQAVLRHLGEPDDIEAHSSPPMARQADEISEEWIARYRAGGTHHV